MFPTVSFPSSRLRGVIDRLVKSSEELRGLVTSTLFFKRKLTWIFSQTLCTKLAWVEDSSCKTQQIILSLVNLWHIKWLQTLKISEVGKAYQKGSLFSGSEGLHSVQNLIVFSKGAWNRWCQLTPPWWRRRNKNQRNLQFFSPSLSSCIFSNLQKKVSQSIQVKLRSNWKKGLQFLQSRWAYWGRRFLSCETLSGTCQMKKLSFSRN